MPTTSSSRLLSGATLLIGGAVLVAAGFRVALRPASGGSAGPRVDRPPVVVPLGVLEADPQWATADAAAGVSTAVVNLDWSAWQPKPSGSDDAYVRRMTAVARRYRAGGWKVAVDIGLQQPPRWILDLPGGQLVDQSGRPSGSANFEFSQPVRAGAERYIASVVAAMGPVSSYRVGPSPSGEMLYPDAPQGEWWAFDGPAQGRTSGLPPGQAPTPMPGWVPGQYLWSGQAVTADQARGWYDWYLTALVSAEAWEIHAYRTAGFAGMLQLVMPGDGATPSDYQRQVAARLAPDAGDRFHTMNVGAVWWRVLDALPDSAGTEVDISSVGDESGDPRANGCQSRDGTVPLAQADPAVSGWSDTRWLSYLARRHGLPAVGENPGHTPPTDVRATVDLAVSCQLAALQWAWDYELHDGGVGRYATLGDLASATRPR